MFFSMACRSLLTLSVVFTLNACGGGGGGGGGSTLAPTPTPTPTPAPPSKSVSLATLESTTVGTLYSATLMGSDTNGGQYIGSISIVNRPQVMLNGVLVTPRDWNIGYVTNLVPTHVTITSYIDANGYEISRDYSGGRHCTAVAPSSFPASVKPGEFGTVVRESCDDNTSIDVSWDVDDLGDGGLRFNMMSSFKDASNTIMLSESLYEGVTLDGAGNIKMYTIAFGFAPLTVTLSSGSLVAH